MGKWTARWRIASIALQRSAFYKSLRAATEQIAALVDLSDGAHRLLAMSKAERDGNEAELRRLSDTKQPVYLDVDRYIEMTLTGVLTP